MVMLSVVVVRIRQVLVSGPSQGDSLHSVER